MSIQAPVYDKSDPKSEKLFPYHLPLTPDWDEKKDIFGSASTMGAGAGMFLKNPMIIWGCLIASVVSYVDYEPLRASKEANSPLLGIGIGLMGLFSMSIPKVLLPAVTQTPVDVPAQ